MLDLIPYRPHASLMPLRPFLLREPEPRVPCLSWRRFRLSSLVDETYQHIRDVIRISHGIRYMPASVASSERGATRKSWRKPGLLLRAAMHLGRSRSPSS